MPSGPIASVGIPPQPGLKIILSFGLNSFRASYRGLYRNRGLIKGDSGSLGSDSSDALQLGKVKRPHPTWWFTHRFVHT